MREKSMKSMKFGRCWRAGVMLVLSVALCLPVLAAQSSAEKLISRVPNDPILVVATSGLAEIQPAFDKSFLGRVAADKGVQTFAQDIMTQVLKLAGDDLPDMNMVKDIQGLVMDVAQSPMLMGIGELTDPQGPVPVYGFVYIEASENKEKVQVLLDMFNQQVGADNMVQKDVQGVTLYGPKGNESVPGYWGWVGDVLVLGVNDAEGLAVKALKSGGAGTKIDALAKLPCHGDAFIEYIQYDKFLTLITNLQPEEDVKQLMSLIYAKSGVTNMKTVAIRMGFEGANMVMDSYAGLKGPRTGIQAQMKPVSADLLSMVPEKAMTASVSHFDIPGTYDMAVKAADEVTQGQATPMVDMVVGMVMAQVGVDVREAIVKNLDGPMLGYMVPQGVEPQALNGGPVGILTLKDADAFADVILTLEKLGATMAQGQFQANTKEVDGRTLHTWAVGPLAMLQLVPTWTVVDGRFVISTDTNLCALAAKQLASRDKSTSLLNSAAFKKASADLPESVMALSFVDTQNQVKQLMGSLQKIWPMGAMLAGTKGVQLPMMLPPLDHLMNDLGPVCNYSVEKDQAIYGHYEGTGVEMALGAGVGAGVGFAMPMIMSKKQSSAPAQALTPVPETSR